jgi:hypothetical protein
MTKLHIYYDKEGDFLELHVGPYRNGYFRELRQGVLERVDAKTKKVTGIAIIGLSRKTARLKELEISLPKGLIA